MLFDSVWGPETLLIQLIMPSKKQEKFKVHGCSLFLLDGSKKKFSLVHLLNWRSLDMMTGGM